MKDVLFKLSSVIFVLIASGCANNPDISISYYLPKSEISLTNTVSMMCSDKGQLLTAHSLTPEVTHKADRTAIETLNLKGIKGSFSDSDIQVEYYPDNRLKSFGGKSTGQGEAILKGAIEFLPIPAFTFLKGGPEKSVKVALPTHPICDSFSSLMDESPFTISYSASIDVNSSSEGSTAMLKPSSSDISHPDLAQQLDQFYGNSCAMVKSLEGGRNLISISNDSKSDYTKSNSIVVLNPSVMTIEVYQDCSNDSYKNSLLTSELNVALADNYSLLPVPKGRVFGSLNTKVSLNESGTPSSISYVSTTGAGQFLNVANALPGPSGKPSTADQAAEVKAKADLIAQQERLLICQADASKCTLD